MYVYILHSLTLGRFYTGFSTFRHKRLRQHQHAQSTWTSRASDWVELWVRQVDTAHDARLIEKQIKARGARHACHVRDRGGPRPPGRGFGTSWD